MIAGTSREMKRRYGVAAYFMAASRLLPQLAPLPTTLEIDGVRTELESVVVLVANCGEAIPGLLRPRLPIAPDDGLFHVFVLPRGGIIGGIRGAMELMTAASHGISPSGHAVRLVGREVRVEVTPAGPDPDRRRPVPRGLARRPAAAGRPARHPAVGRTAAGSACTNGRAAPP